jgi:hypothetical protein
MTELPTDDYRSLIESVALERDSEAKTEWVVDMRNELLDFVIRVTVTDVIDGAVPYQDEQILIRSIRKDLKILSQNLAVRRGDISEENYIDIPDYHQDNAGPE